jgi:hypothetical protein
MQYVATARIAGFVSIVVYGKHGAVKVGAVVLMGIPRRY